MFDPIVRCTAEYTTKLLFDGLELLRPFRVVLLYFHKEHFDTKMIVLPRTVLLQERKSLRTTRAIYDSLVRDEVIHVQRKCDSRCI